MTTIRARFLVAALAALVLDIVTKLVAVQTLSDRVVDLGILKLRLVRNDGVAFGLGTSIAPTVL